MGKRTEKSQKKSKIIFLIILIAALISITGTYAWFSSQRDVEIVGFKVNVEIAENLEISLDGEQWTHSINIENMRQFYGTYVDYSPNTPVYQAKKDQHRNYVPTELLPVSTIGAVENGNLLFAKGDVKDNKLTNIVQCSEEDIIVGSTIRDKEAKNDQHPYLAFDMYLRNLSRLSNEGDTLQLNTGSIVSASEKNTGLEYSVRVALVKYENTIPISYQESDTGEKIRAIAPSSDDSEKVVIWEPNSKFHAPFVVNNDSRITNSIQAIETRAIAVTKAGVPTAEIVNITDSNETALQVVTTNKPIQAEDKDSIEAQNYETTELLNLVQTDGQEMKLQPNTITKVRCYIWLEGQDPDCVNISSTGKEVIATLRLIKPSANIDGNNSYSEPNTN